MLKFNSTILLNRSLLDRVHRTLEACQFCRIFVVAFRQQECRPKDDQADAHGDLVSRRFLILEAGRLGGPRGNPLRFLAQLRTGEALISNRRNVGSADLAGSPDVERFLASLSIAPRERV